jgi:hypothetical protein
VVAGSVQRTQTPLVPQVDATGRGRLLPRAIRLPSGDKCVPQESGVIFNAATSCATAGRGEWLMAGVGFLADGELAVVRRTMTGSWARRTHVRCGGHQERFGRPAGGLGAGGRRAGRACSGARRGRARFGPRTGRARRNFLNGDRVGWAGAAHTGCGPKVQSLATGIAPGAGGGSRWSPWDAGAVRAEPVEAQSPAIPRVSDALVESFQKGSAPRLTCGGMVLNVAGMVADERAGHGALPRR